MVNRPVEQKDFRAYLRPVLARWWLILLVVPVVTVGTYLYYSHKPKVYTASTELFVQPSVLNQILVGTNAVSASQSTIENLAFLIHTKAVAEAAQEQLSKTRSGASGAAGSISAQPLQKSDFIAIVATASTPRGAAQLANAYANAFVNTQTRQLRSEANQTLRAARAQLSHLGSSGGGSKASAQRQALEERIQTLQLVASQSGGGAGIRQVEPAVPSSSPTGPDPKSRAIFALVIGLTLAIGAAFGLEYVNRKLTSVESVEEIFEAPVLAEIPTSGALASPDRGGAGIATALREPFCRLQTNLEMLAHEQGLRTILVASAAPGEGKSIVASNLGLAYREAGRNVAVLDADFRKATLGALLATREGPGLTDVLTGRASFGQAVQEVPVPGTTPNGNGAAGEQVLAQSAAAASVSQITHGELAVVPAGAHHGSIAGALASGGLRQALSAAAEAYDAVIIDSSPLLAVADVLPLLSEADGVLLVTRLGVTTRDSAQRMLRELKRVPNIHVVGVVVNGIPPRTFRTRAYGGYNR